MLQQLNKKIIKVGFYGLMIVIGISVIFPVYWMVKTSLEIEGVMFTYPPRIISIPDFTPYKKVLLDGDIFRWIFNSLKVSGGAVLLNLFVATFAAYAIARYRFKLRYTLLFIVLLTQLIPAPLIVVPLFVIFRRAGLMDRLFALVLVDAMITLPVSVWILSGFIRQIPHDIFDAGRIDGCSELKLLQKIGLPLISPILITIALLTFFDVWNEFMFAYTFISSADKWVGTYGLSRFISMGIFRWRELMASSTLFAIIPFVLYLTLRNYIVRGVQQGFSMK